MAAGRKKKPALLHAAKKEAGTGGAAYRALPPGAAGIASAAGMEREEQFCAVMEEFRKLGFISQRPVRAASRARESGRRGGALARRAKIEAVRRAYAGCKDERGLRKFIKRTAKAGRPRFLNAALARKVIIALEQIKKQGTKVGDASKVRRER